MDYNAIETTLETIETATEASTEHTYFFVWLKAAIAGIGSGFSIAFGWLGWLVVAWVLCMLLDWVTGNVAACKQGTWSSSTARDGIFHKAGMMVVVLTSAIADGVLGVMLANLPSLSLVYTSALLPMVLVWYIFTELGSIAENATEMGAPVPSILTNMLAAGQAVTEGTT